jgi:hypothetical protein
MSPYSIIFFPRLNSLIKSVHVITHWLSWIPGSGHLISIGRDKILGLGDNSMLSPALITLLRQKKITVLAQAKGPRTTLHTLKTGSAARSWVLQVTWQMNGTIFVERL